VIRKSIQKPGESRRKKVANADLSLHSEEKFITEIEQSPQDNELLIRNHSSEKKGINAYLSGIFGTEIIHVVDKQDPLNESLSNASQSQFNPVMNKTHSNFKESAIFMSQSMRSSIVPNTTAGETPGPGSYITGFQQLKEA
jgi:hypothetical protein